MKERLDNINDNVDWVMILGFILSRWGEWKRIEVLGWIGLAMIALAFCGYVYYLVKVYPFFRSGEVKKWRYVMASAMGVVCLLIVALTLFTNVI